MAVENAVKRAMRRELRRLLATVFFFEKKIHGSMFQAGLPDHLLVCRCRVAWIETKKVGEQLSPLQLVEFAKMVQAGAVIFVGDDGPGLARAAAEFVLRGDRSLCWPAVEIRVEKKRLATGGRSRAEREGARVW